MKKIRLSLVFALSFPSIACAQSISLADLQKQIDAETNKAGEYAGVLNDPDPKRARAAMKVMLGSGDPDLVSIALDYGLYSPNLAVRGEAIKGLLDSKPRVDVFLSMTDPNDSFSQAVDYMFNTTPTAEGVASVPILITDYDENLDCYLSDFEKYKSNGNRCFLQVRPEVVRVSLGFGWSEVKMNDDGALIGEAKLSSSQMVPIRVQLH